MKWSLFSVIFSLFFITHPFPPFSNAATYYVRPDGGTAEQCTGSADAPYPGSGSGQACAWSHPFWALNGSGQWKILGGDMLILDPGNYKMGFGAPNTNWCSADSAYDCVLPPVPSGPDPSHPTYLLGIGCEGSYANAPEIWGTQRPWQLIDLSKSSNVQVECLNITDHSGCVEHHADPAARCQRDSYPFGDWASIGLVAADSSNITLRHLNIHGLASGGVRAGRLSNWTVEDVRIAGNGWSGWDGDIEGLDSNSGELIFRKWLVEWNGCGETYPDKKPYGCWSQTAGGYGDGVGTGLTGGHWIIEDSIFRYNTSDGLDLLYTRESNSLIEIRRSQAYGNAGNQFKINGTAKIENTVGIGNCGFFEGKSFTYGVDNCRAAGNAFSLNVRRGSAVSVVNSTVAGHGDCLVVFQCDDDSCNGTELLTMQNNIFLGSQEFGSSDEQTSYLWMDRDDLYLTKLDYNVLFNGKTGSYVQGTHDIVQEPLFINAFIDTFDGRLLPESPAIDNGLSVGSLGGLIPADDLTGYSRPYGNGVDRGAYEYVGAAAILSVSPVRRDVAKDEGATTFSVSNAGTGTMPWTAAVTSGVSWLSITSGTSGSNNGIISCSFTANTSALPRNATIRVDATSATGSPMDVFVAQASKPTECMATLDKNLLLRIPYLSYVNGTISLWADLTYDFNPTHPNLLPFKLTNYGVINNPSFSCAASTLSSDFKIHIPDIQLPDGITHIWVDLEYSPVLSTSENSRFLVTTYGGISN